MKHFLFPSTSNQIRYDPVLQKLIHLTFSNWFVISRIKTKRKQNHFKECTENCCKPRLTHFTRLLTKRGSNPEYSVLLATLQMGCLINLNEHVLRKK